MTLPWVLYAVVVSLALGGAGAAMERVLRLYDLQARFAWVAAMLGSMVIPVVALLGLLVSGFTAPTDQLPAWAVPAAPAVVDAARGMVEAGGSVFSWFEWGFYAVWAAGTLVLAGWIVTSASSLRQKEPRWKRVAVPGDDVYRDEELGPAAVGLLEPKVVVPDWVMKLGDGDRRMVLLHEREHARTADPALIAGGWLLVALAPWNLPLWWHIRRLRQAIELDCDLRVVRRTRDPEGYGRVLLEAARMSRDSVLPLRAGGDSFIGDRIRSLMDGTPTMRPLRAATGLAVVLCAGVVATTLPSPRAAPAWTAKALFQRAVQSEKPVSRTDPTITNRHEVERALRRRHPDDLRKRGVGGRSRVLLRVGADGRVEEAAIVESTGKPRLDRIARRVARMIRFAAPAGQGRAGYWFVKTLRFRAD